MISNITSIESHLLLITLSQPIEANEVLQAVRRAVVDRSVGNELPFGILVDAGKNNLPLSEQSAQSLEKLLLGLRDYGPVAVFALPQPLESLLKLVAPAQEPSSYPLYLVEDQEAAIALIRNLRTLSDGTPSVYSMGRSTANPMPAFRNIQTQRMFQGFIANSALCREWRTMVDSLYDSGEIAFETVMFAKLHKLGDTTDLTIDWHAIIMALLNETDR